MCNLTDDRLDRKARAQLTRSSHRRTIGHICKINCTFEMTNRQSVHLGECLDGSHLCGWSLIHGPTRVQRRIDPQCGEPSICAVSRLVAVADLLTTTDQLEVILSRERQTHGPSRAVGSNGGQTGHPAGVGRLAAKAAACPAMDHTNLGLVQAESGRDRAVSGTRPLHASVHHNGTLLVGNRVRGQWFHVEVVLRADQHAAAQDAAAILLRERLLCGGRIADLVVALWDVSRGILHGALQRETGRIGSNSVGVADTHEASGTPR
mmetsp:Transcript_11149/g.34187  ORF Transcript_11149/g.34187 Transcript_11149/m.34187 type:complete len:264 (+) Transcript_11149:1369-2160(+)